MALLGNAGVGRSQIIWLIGFSDCIFEGKLAPVTSADVTKLQSISLGIERALANPLPVKSTSAVPKTRHAAQKIARNLKKHPKARRGHIDDDFS